MTVYQTMIEDFSPQLFGGGSEDWPRSVLREGHASAPILYLEEFCEI